MQQACQPRADGEKVPPLVPCRLTDSGGPAPDFRQQARCYFARSRLLSPDKRRRVGRRGGGRGNKAVRGPSAAALASTMTTRAGLSPLIKGYTQLGKQHPRQAMALVECCTSVTQSKRQAGIIRAATLVRGAATEKKKKKLCSVTCWVWPVCRFSTSGVNCISGIASEGTSPHPCPGRAP